MFYKASSKQTGNMWDTWLFFRDGTFYLYYLANVGSQWDNISMATSPDGIHWKERGPVLTKGPEVTWMGTGSTWQSPSFDKDGKSFMNFSEWTASRQTIFFAESKDLLHWTRLGSEREFVQEERWYKREGRWDCIWTIPRPGGGLYGYWTATPRPETGGRFGFGESVDGVTWKGLEPPKVFGAGEGEVGAIERIGDRYYMMFGTGGFMATLIADRPEGPFRAAGKNYRLLSGHTYFARFFNSPSGLLVNHDSIARDGQVYFAPLKRALLDEEGTLRLAWWNGNDGFKRDATEMPLALPAANATRPIRMLESRLDATSGVIIEGIMTLPAEGEDRTGIYTECGNESGTAILVAGNGTTELGSIKADGTGFTPEKAVNRDFAFKKTCSFRLLIKGSLLEFYLDDLLIECFSLPACTTGRIGLIPGAAGCPFSAMTAASLTNGSHANASPVAAKP